MKKFIVSFLIYALAAPFANAALAKIDVGDDGAHIDVGFRLQTLAIFSEKDVDGDGSYESYDDFKVRRGRLRLKAVANDMISGFIQTDISSSDDASGEDMRVIDAFLDINLDPMLHIYTGMIMASASRINYTSSGALMCMDFPALTYKNLTWGARAVHTIANSTYSDSDSGLRGDNSVRDTGITLFGATSFTESAHFKYYLGVHDGIDEAKEDNLRYTARAQFNFMDPEAGFYNSTTHLGKINTIGIGLGIDTQESVATDTIKGDIDYTYSTFDLFLEKQMGEGSISAELGYINLDLDDATMLQYSGSADLTKDANRSQGDGYYFQLGYFINNWQPWFLYETWDSDSSDGKGSFNNMRIGISYFLKGHTANIKAGYEVFEADENIGSSQEDQVKSFVLGAYMTY